MSIARLMLMGAAAPTGPEGAWDLSYAYYDPSEAWDISAAAYANIAKSISAQEAGPTGVFFKSDGTKMYILGGVGDDVNEYNLSTAWKVDTASYVQNFSIASQDTAPLGFFFKADGTKMYVSGGNGDAIFEYSISTAWDISTASYVQSFDVSGQETEPRNIFFKPDGTKMYVAGNASNSVLEYNLSTAWDISTASYFQSLDVFSQESNPYGLSFKPDGTKMYIVGVNGDDVNEYSLSTAWDVSTASYVQNFSVASQETLPNGLFFKPDGTAFYIVGSLNDTVYQYTIGGFSVAAEETNPYGIFFKSDGTKMYVVGSAGDDVNEYDLSSAWDVSTASYLQNFSVAAQETNPRGIFFKPDGVKMYVTGLTDNVNEYDLSSAWDVSTASYLQNFSVATQETSPQDVFFKSDGTKMYVVGSAGDDVNEYDLSTAWDVSTASYLQNFSVAAQETAPSGLFFKPDGTKMYVVGVGHDVNEYDLSSAWDVSTASYLQNFSVIVQAVNPSSVFFKDDGTQMFVMNTTYDTVAAYTLGVQP